MITSSLANRPSYSVNQDDKQIPGGLDMVKPMTTYFHDGLKVKFWHPEQCDQSEFLMGTGHP